MIRSRPIFWKSTSIVLSSLLILNGLFFYGFVRDGLWLILAVLLIPLCRKVGHLNFLTLALSFSFLTLGLLGIARWLEPDAGIYQDPSSRLSTIDSDGLPVYQKNAEWNRVQPFGDLRRIADPDLTFELQSRSIRFQTDGFGFRNATDYHGQRFVLVGDSFVVGNGNTQENNLTGQLKRDFGVDVYNLGFPTDITGYVQNIQKFEQRYGSRFRVLLFIYEGNDFPEKGETMDSDAVTRIKNTVRQWVRAYKRFFWDTHLYRYTSFLYQSFKTDLRTANQVFVAQVGDRRIAMSNGYAGVARRTAYTLPLHLTEALERVGGHIERIYFIPVKFRVLQAVMEKTEDLPNRQWDALKEWADEKNLPVTNLTGALQQATREAFQKDGGLTYWTDDTHWNPVGIAAAARTVCQTVPALGCRMPQPQGEPGPTQPLTVSHN